MLWAFDPRQPLLGAGKIGQVFGLIALVGNETVIGRKRLIPNPISNNRIPSSLRIGLFFALALLGVVPPIRAETAQKCVNAPPGRTLNYALQEEAEINRKASQLKGIVAQSNAVFEGWKAIPSDVKVLSGPVQVHVIYQTDLKSLPSIKAGGAGMLVPDYSMLADCIVEALDGQQWIVTHSKNGTKDYIFGKDTEQTGKIGR